MDEKNVPAEEVSAAEEESKKDKTLITRRDFLIGAGAGAVAGAAVAGVGVATTLKPGAPTIEPVAQQVEAPPEVTTVEVMAKELPATMRRVTLNINGKDYDVTTDVRWSLWEVLVYKLGLAGTKRGCDRAECGACAVTVNGRAVNGCTVLAARLGGTKIVTVEGLASGATYEELHPIQRAYIEEGGFQCGICTAGFVMSSYALLSNNLNPTEDDIREALAGNICRCSEYPKVYDSVLAAAEEMRS
jgi:aerobic-type carbon monoxide dehydrogenase small subunit (CoxS/CutS family)